MGINRKEISYKRARVRAAATGNILMFLGIHSLAMPVEARVPQEALGLVAAERAFAADARRIGITAAFRTHVAPDGILIRPDPTPALEALAKDIDVPGQRLEWQPAIAAIAWSGDLGFTTGPYYFTIGETTLSGRYLTIWERGADGRWRWFLDHGLPGTKAASIKPFPSEAVMLRNGVVDADQNDRPQSASSADAALNAAILTSGTTVIPRWLASDGFLLRPARGMVGKRDAVRASGKRIHMRAAQTSGMRFSRAGDLAASYGYLSNSQTGTKHYYVRVWRRDRSGWRLLVDELT